jgi:hypothetical protein
MRDTFIFGKGSSRNNAVTAKGLQPHNTFLWLHVAYGGVCAWTYVVWIIFITWKIGSLFGVQGGETGRKIEILTFLVLFLFPHFVNVFALGHYGNILALAILEKSLFARKHIVSTTQQSIPLRN